MTGLRESIVVEIERVKRRLRFDQSSYQLPAEARPSAVRAEL